MTIPVLRARLDVPFECSFTKAASMNARPTYELPPITTIQGMLYGAIGRPSLLLQGGRGRTMDKATFDAEREFREHVQEECRFGIRVVEAGTHRSGLRKLHKKETADSERQFLTYVTNVETLVSPTYRMYVTGPEELLETFAGGLRDPERLLYLGRSDDLVDIKDVDMTTAECIEKRTTVDCAVPGTGESPTMLPVEADTKVGRRKQPSRVKTIAAEGGEVDTYYTTSDGEQFVFIT